MMQNIDDLIRRVEDTISYAMSRSDPRLEEIMVAYDYGESSRVGGQLKTGIKGSITVMFFLENAPGYEDLYLRLMSISPLQLAGNVQNGMGLVGLLGTPFFHDGRDGTNPILLSLPYAVFPFTSELTREDNIRRLSKKFDWLKFSYSPTGTREKTEDEIMSSDPNHYSARLSCRFLGDNLDAARKNAKTDLGKILVLNVQYAIVTSVTRWQSKSSTDPNEPDYAFWVARSDQELGFEIKILRDCMVIIPHKYESGNHDSISQILRLVYENARKIAK